MHSSITVQDLATGEPLDSAVYNLQSMGTHHFPLVYQLEILNPSSNSMEGEYQIEVLDVFDDGS